MAQKRKLSAIEVLEAIWDDTEEEMDVSQYDSDELESENDDDMLRADDMDIPADSDIQNCVQVGDDNNNMDIQVGDDNNNRHDHVGDDSRSSASEDDIPGPSRPGGTQVRGQPNVHVPPQPPAPLVPPTVSYPVNAQGVKKGSSRGLG